MNNPTIEQLAEEKYPIEGKMGYHIIDTQRKHHFFPHENLFLNEGFKVGYETCAASQSTRIEQLEEGLKAIVAYKHGGYSMMEDYITLKQIAAEALNIK